MKRFLFFLLAVCMVSALFGCKKENPATCRICGKSSVEEVCFIPGDGFYCFDCKPASLPVQKFNP